MSRNTTIRRLKPSNWSYYNLPLDNVLQSYYTNTMSKYQLTEADNTFTGDDYHDMHGDGTLVVAVMLLAIIGSIIGILCILLK